ncbi:unnamed protein product [Prunus armeniaca]|uniref:GRIP domain-containing protein n=1 Tax=Prunus armeniaca TaxID=36596 RepID=A0A6J5Y4B0_PRUAR|nr:unnamed protein product [Prunus armeniaca]
MTYLKNIILKLLETGEVEALLPVLGMILQLSPDEVNLRSYDAPKPSHFPLVMHKCQQAYRASGDLYCPENVNYDRAIIRHEECNKRKHRGRALEGTAPIRNLNARF